MSTPVKLWRIVIVLAVVLAAAALVLSGWVLFSERNDASETRAASLAVCKQLNRVRSEVGGNRASVKLLAQTMVRVRRFLIEMGVSPPLAEELAREVVPLAREVTELRQPVPRFSCKQQLDA